ncbi:hypothetical protein F5Y10DRAFT_162073 [Nemania abortiva]|nr:hypothetical protein F5Y10DRAFT_162073 [Nemania abortiva]
MEAVDTPPESSLYTGPLATLHFGGGPLLSAPTALINKHPNPSSRCEQDMLLHLRDIPGIHGAPPLERSAAESGEIVECTQLPRKMSWLH